MCLCGRHEAYSGTPLIQTPMGQDGNSEVSVFWGLNSVIERGSTVTLHSCPSCYFAKKMMEENAVLTMLAHGCKENAIQSCIMSSQSNGAEEQMLIALHTNENIGHKCNTSLTEKTIMRISRCQISHLVSLWRKSFHNYRIARFRCFCSGDI